MIEQQMINQQKIEQYKSIKAPESLREKVMARCINTVSDGEMTMTDRKISRSDKLPNQQPTEAERRLHRLITRFRPVIGVAACLAVIIGISLASIGNWGSTTILISEMEVGTTPVSLNPENTNSRISPMRLREVLTIPITVDSRKDALAEVSDGILQHYDSEGMFLGESDNVTFSSDEQLVWLLEDAGSDARAELVITIGKKSTHYEVVEDSLTGIFRIHLIQ